MESIRSRVIKSCVQPQVSHTCVSVTNTLIQDESVPGVGIHDTGGSQQEVTPASDTRMNSHSHIAETTGPSGNIVSNMSHMASKDSIGTSPQNLALIYVDC